MRLTVVGCSGSFPGPDSAASCYLVEADGFLVVLDFGSGALGPLARHTDIYAVHAVLLSHLHADHCLDLCAYHVARRYRPGPPLPPVAVHGPGATAKRLAAAYALEPDPAPGLAASFAFTPLSAGATATVGPLRIRAERVAHPGEAFALRIEHDGRVLAYSGDTGPTPALVEAARDADLLLCEASFQDGLDNPGGMHLTGRQAAEHADRAGARRLVLTHVPPWHDATRALDEAAPAYRGPLELAQPGATYDV